MDRRCRYATPSEFVFRSTIPAAASEVFRWHEHPAALLALLPSPWVRLEHRDGGVRDGATVSFSIGVGPLRVRWEARHFGFVADRQFCDEQVHGPFALWRHFHRVEPLADWLTLYEDRVEYVLPGGRLMTRIGVPLVRRLLERTFAERHRIVREHVCAGLRRAAPSERSGDSNGSRTRAQTA